MAQISWDCSIAPVLEMIGVKWTINVLWQIQKHEGIRFNQLNRDVKGITTIMLTRTLDKLMADGLVSKKDFQENPPHVEYFLTDKGSSLMPLLRELSQWGQDLRD